MTYTREFATNDKNLTIDLRRGDSSHPVLEGTQVPDWNAFRTVGQLRDAIDMHGIAWKSTVPTEAQRMRLQETTGVALCMAINKLGADQVEALKLIHRGRFNRFNRGTAELCEEAVAAWNLMLAYEARVAS
ncbi:hypothetical protein ASH00_15885 [Arthrobacter sp. Soil782]|uniref:hypothetical protein n=1 Tax=Arthrobacter sp. Soil782 TaxID=1736410 RepID=UPI0006FAFE2D|nr:hypothetical protein [Arthrobacter sp. Soil782]KRF03265.1 hypothetical protein ASH00_15885 [Arthrobacter sp. Soil782]